MSTKKENILKRLGDYLDTIFTAEEPIVAPIVDLAVGDPSTADPELPVENALPGELIVGESLPDGEYEIMDQIVILKGGVIESVSPKAEMPVEQEAATSGGTFIKTTTIKEETKLSADLKLEFETKLAEQKAEFELKLKTLSDAQKASGIIQAPVDKTEPPRSYSAKEQILRNIENRNK